MAYGLLESIDISTQLAGHNRLALLLFRLGTRQIFGINVFKVQEVIKSPALTHMPGAHPHVRGVLDLRGRVVPVIDLRRAIGMEDDDALPAPAHLVVAEFNRSVQAFLVEQVERIVHLDVAELKPAPERDAYLTAVVRFQQQDVGIIDVEKVLAEILGGPAGLSERISASVAGLDAGGLKVLVVDDSRVARTQIEGVLRELGIGALMAADGREALELLQMMAADGPLAEQLLMVISDVEMPTMDGYRLTTEIRHDPALQSLYVLLHSSLSGVFNTAMVEKVGADRFIAKFSSDELAQAVIGRLEAVIAAH
ncbi:chemotaxis protein CheV [Solimonas marina]|uniref:Chemotaxis protein CheV n=1 Tax=Solimonas marina TaxID=2714601 RepID=A0A969WBC6_9GAMM|nr:chemotaxis protein CheV [Solimonas marina]NKF21750.1 chemotaxis protein CheV [Solimonas marina]